MNNANPQDVSYDLETFGDTFTAVFVHIATGWRWIFEISPRKNHSKELHAFLRRAESFKMRFVGFNNEFFDYVVLHEFMRIFAADGIVTAQQLKMKANAVINSGDNRFAHAIWSRDRYVEQLDTFKVHHFDNMAKSTSLKALEINMKSHSVIDLPYDHESYLTSEQIDKVIHYNCHDVAETTKFYFHSLEMINFRSTLSQRYPSIDFTNFNDTKIGKEFFIMRLEEAQPGICFDYVGRKKVPRQTPRREIPLNDVIFPYVRFDRPEFETVLRYLRTVILTNTKSAPELKGLSAVVDGFSFDFGTGGIHGSVDRKIVRSNDEYIIIDADVTSFYPNLAIRNRVFPAHLSELFCDIYEDLYNERALYDKSTPESAMIKLALNGVYGDSNNEHGPFLDPKYTMTITVNGQLSIAMLSEQLINRAGAVMIQANTDGISVRIPRKNRAIYDEVCAEWCALTKLDLEFVEYDGMWIRDVNSYLARSTKGKVKRVGAYQHLRPCEAAVAKIKPELGWHQDHSGLVIPKAAEAVMLEGANLQDFMYGHRDAFDYMMRAKVPRSSRLMHGDTQVQNISRYYIANDGPGLTKIMPPTPKKPDAERHIGINVGWPVAMCNTLDDWNWNTLNRAFYMQEAQKLILTPDN